MPDFTGGQFPSLDGEPEAEVAQRTEAPTEGNWFRRVFTIHNRNHTPDLPVEHEHHFANLHAVLQDALQRGLHPKAAPELESEQPHPTDPNSTDLTYRVQVVPAVADQHPETTVTPGVLPQVLADPNALEATPDAPEVQHPTRWETGEREKDQTPAPATAQELSETVPAPSKKSAPAETPTAAPEASETPSE